MSPTAELRWIVRHVTHQPYENIGVPSEVMQQKWVEHHIQAGQTEAAYEWRDVPTVKDGS